jgi:hypothetical protein
MRRAFILPLVWLLTALLTLSPVPRQARAAESSAQSAEQRAAELKAQGDEAMQSLRYAEALERYRDAYALLENPALLYNQGRACQALARYAEALDYFEAFERDASPALRARVPKLEELVAEVRARVSTLVLAARKPGARVLVRGQLVGTTPLSEPLRLNAGSATLEVLLEGHHPFRQTLTLPGANETKVTVELIPKDTTGRLHVRSATAGASVFVDGRRIGTTPVDAILSAGQHRISLRKDGYQETQTNVVVTAGSERTMDVALEKQAGLHQKWWFWAGLSAVAVSGAAVTTALLTERSPDRGSISPGQVSAPLRF